MERHGDAEREIATESHGKTRTQRKMRRCGEVLKVGDGDWEIGRRGERDRERRTVWSMK